LLVNIAQEAFYLSRIVPQFDVQEWVQVQHVRREGRDVYDRQTEGFFRAIECSRSAKQIPSSPKFPPASCQRCKSPAHIPLKFAPPRSLQPPRHQPLLKSNLPVYTGPGMYAPHPVTKRALGGSFGSKTVSPGSLAWSIERHRSGPTDRPLFCSAADATSDTRDNAGLIHPPTCILETC